MDNTVLTIELDATQANETIDALTAKVDALQAKVSALKASMSDLSEVRISSRELLGALKITTGRIRTDANTGPLSSDH